MRQICDRIYEIEGRFRDYDAMLFPPGHPKSEIMPLAQGKTAIARALNRELSELIKNWLEPLFRQPESIQDEDVEPLAELADKLSGYAPGRLDNGLACLLHTALLRKARAVESIDMIARHAFYRGLTLFYMDSVIFSEEMYESFGIVAAMADTYHELENKQTRQLVCRALGNMHLASADSTKFKKNWQRYLDHQDAAVAFYQREDVRARDPDFPWMTYELAVQQAMTTRLQQLTRAGEEPERWRFLIPRIYNAACFIYEHRKEAMALAQFRTSAPRILFAYHAARYHQGELPLDDLLVLLLEEYDRADDGYEAENIYRKIYVATHWMEYVYERIEGPRPEETENINRVIDEVIQYIARMPRDAATQTVNSLLGTFVNACSLMRRSVDFLDLALRVTSLRHFATYVHSMMVGRLARLLTDWLAKYEPESLVGLCGTSDTAQVAARAKELCDYAELCGQCHDMGKVQYINTMSTYARRLVEQEFRVIRSHPTAGAELIRSIGGGDRLADIALGHHRWYDGTGGYPEDFDNTASSCRAMIDIITVADSIDAATDSIGRAYAKTLSQQEIINEIVAEAGTRYSPACARALQDPGLQAMLSTALTLRRQDVYYQAYLTL